MNFDAVTPIRPSRATEPIRAADKWLLNGAVEMFVFDIRWFVAHFDRENILCASFLLKFFKTQI